jgi:hypothetical protein
MAASALPATGQKKLFSIDFFGGDGLDIAAVRNALPLQAGDVFPPPTALPGLKTQTREAVRKATGTTATDVAAVCCSSDGHWMLFVGLAGASQAPVPLRARPAGKAGMPAELLAMSRVISKHWMLAVQRGQMGEDRHLGYSLLHDPATRRLQLAYREAVRRREEAIYRVLAESALDEHRQTAAEAIGYAAPTRRRVEALAEAALDANEDVRNNAIRALLVALEAEPGSAAQLPLERLAALVGSPSWTDRNKGTGLFEVLTRSRNEAVLAVLRPGLLRKALREIARWRNPGHAHAALAIEGRLAGIPERELQRLLTAGDVEAILGGR